MMCIYSLMEKVALVIESKYRYCCSNIQYINNCYSPLLLYSGFPRSWNFWKNFEIRKHNFQSWKVLNFFVYALFLAIDFVKNKIKNKICNKASAENSRPTSSQCDALRRIVSLSVGCFQQKLCYIFCICFRFLFFLQNQ